MMGGDSSDSVRAFRALRALAQDLSHLGTEQLLADLEGLESGPRTLAVRVLPRRKLSPEQLQRIHALRDDPKHRPRVRLAALETLMEIAREQVAAAQGEAAMGAKE